MPPNEANIVFRAGRIWRGGVGALYDHYRKENRNSFFLLQRLVEKFRKL
jgi:hypothetical protein